MDTNIKDRWLMTIQERREEKTYISYKSQINMIYSDFIEKLNIHDEIGLIKAITNDFLEDYIRELKEIYKLATVNARINTLELFFEYVINSKHIIEYNPLGGITQYNITEDDRKEKYVPTKEEVNKLIEACDIRVKGARDFEFLSARDKFIISFLATNGSRVRELLDATMDMLEKNDLGYSINLNKNMVKNDIDKRLLITGKTLDYFNEYLIERTSKMSNRKNIDDNIILSARGRVVDTNKLNDMIAKQCEKAEVRRFTSHSFRHFVAVAYTNMEVSENITNISLGWKMKGMSKIYANHLKQYDIVRSNIMKKII